MMKVDDGKYIVFKRQEFFELMGELGLPPFVGHEEASAKWDCAPMAQRIAERAAQTCLHDAVVIRRQDVFAAPALEAYANAIQTVIEAMSVEGVVLEDGVSVETLREVADYFHEQASKSYDTPGRKLPTP